VCAARCARPRRENVETFIRVNLLAISNFDSCNRIRVAGHLQGSVGGQSKLIYEITGTRTIAHEYTNHDLGHVFRHVVVEIVLIGELWHGPAIVRKVRHG